MEEIDFQSDSFEDIVAKDSRYDARAYALLMDVVHCWAIAVSAIFVAPVVATVAVYMTLYFGRGK